MAAEVLTGVFLLLLAGFIHRRYRWRSERSWVLFDWDVVADKAPPKHFSFGGRFLGSAKNVRTPILQLTSGLGFEGSTWKSWLEAF